MEITDEKPGSSATAVGADTVGVRRVRRSRHKRRKRKRLLTKIALAAGVFLALMTVYGIVVSIRLGQAAVHLRAAKGASQVAAEAIRQNDLARARRELKRASDEFVQARNRLGSLEVKLLRKIPVVGSNVKVATALSYAGAKVADAGAQVLEEARILEDEGGRLRFPFDSGRVDVEKLEALRTPVAKAARSIEEATAAVAQSPSSMLVGSVAEARNEFLDRIGDVQPSLDEASAYLDVAPDLLGRQGRRTYLVAIGNNAEMNSGGMVLAYGLLEVERGSFTWSRIGSVTELQLETPVSVPQEPGFYARWSWANPNFAWQRTNVSIDTEAAGALMAAMIRARTGRAVDGVLYMDGVAIGYLLQATGPIRFENPNVLLDASNFADYTMNRAYFEFTNQSQRKEFLVEAAERAIGASFLIRGSAAEQLAEAVGRAISERRLWVWAADGSLEDRLSRVPLGGAALPEVEQSPRPGGRPVAPEVAGDFVSYSLINLAGNKVDYYIFNSISHRVEIDSGGAARVDVRFKIENRAPPDLPIYIGGATGAGQAQRARGEYLGYLTWYAPPGSELSGAGSAEVQSDLPDGGFAAFSWSVSIPPASEKTLEFSYRLPDNYLLREAGGRSRYLLTYVPQPRIRPDEFSSEVVVGGRVGIEPETSYGKGEVGTVYYSDLPPSRIRLEAVLRFAGR